MVEREATVAASYEPPTVSDLPTDGPSSVCAMIVPISTTD